MKPRRFNLDYWIPEPRIVRVLGNNRFTRRVCRLLKISPDREPIMKEIKSDSPEYELAHYEECIIHGIAPYNLVRKDNV